MTGWRETTTGDLLKRGVIEIGDGYRAKNSEFVTHGGLPFVRVADVSTTIRLDGLDELPIEKMSKYRPKVSRPFDSLITMKGTVGRVAYVKAWERPFVYSPQMSYWRSHDPDQVNPRWLRYWLESPEFRAQASATKGATDMADYINLRDQRRMRITLPPQEVQARVAEVIGSFDDLIENNRRRIELLEYMVQAIYREWFVHFRFPGHQDTTVVDSALGPIPAGWEVKPLGALATLDRSSVHPRRSPDETFDHYSIPAFDDGQLPVLDKGEAIKSGKFSLTGPAVMVSKLNPRIERTWFVEPMGDRRSVASTEFLVIRPKTEFPLEFLYLLARSTNFQQRMRELSGGTSTSHQRAKPNDFLQIDVLSPPAVLADRLAELVASPLRMTRVLRVEGRKLVAIRDLLLPKLVTGQIDVSELDLVAVVESVA